MDVFSDVLDSVRLTSHVYCRNDVTAPWGWTFGAINAMSFHVVDRGGCWLQLEGATPISLAAGDLIVLPHGDAHSLSDQLDTNLEPFNASQATSSGCPRLSVGGGGPLTTLICGRFDLEDTSHPLVSLLPRVIHIRGEDGQSVAWLEGTLKFLAAEAGSGRPGTDTLVQRLTDVLFVQMIRVWIEQNPDAHGWLGALRDPKIGAALGLMHAQPAHDWTVSSLADGVTMSRSAFASRFTALVGEPPSAYLTRWRMRTAARMLRQNKLPLARIAERVGYESEASFSVAFKRHIGVPPGTYRNTTREGR